MDDIRTLTLQQMIFQDKNDKQLLAKSTKYTSSVL